MIFPSCKQTTQLVSEQLDRPLTRRERFAMRLHLLLCSACRAYRRQLLALTRLLHQTPIPPTNAPLPEDAKTRIKSALQQNKSDPHP